MANFFRSVLLRLQNKSKAATTSNQSVTADAGYDGLGTVTITPQQHSGTYTPAANKSNNDMGAVHNNRYVNTSGMIVPSGAKSITANGTGIDVSSYATANVNVPNPTLSGNATAAYVYPGKTFYSNSYTKQTGTMTTKAAATYNTSTSDQPIDSGQYLTGTQTIKAVKTVNISAANIKTGVTVTVGDANSATRIANVAGTFTKANTVSSGQTAAAAGQILSGYSAWVDGAEVKGSYTAPTITSITPSNSAVFSLDPTKTYKVTTAGQCIKKSTTVSSSNSNPPYLQPPYEGDGLYYVGSGGSGYLIESYDTITPTDSPVTVSDGGIYKMDGEGSVIKGSIPILSLSSVPTSFQANKAYKTVEAGYAIRSYQNNIIPSASGASFNKGMVKMTEAGYAYSAKPSETTLYTNSSPTNGIPNGTILNLSQSMSNFTHLKFYWRYSITNEGTISSVIIAVSDMKNCTNAAFAPRLVLGGWNNTSKMNFARCIKYNSDTSVYCYNGVKCWGSGTMESNAGWIIPTKITGLKMHAIG